MQLVSYWELGEHKSSNRETMMCSNYFRSGFVNGKEFYISFIK